MGMEEQFHPFVIVGLCVKILSRSDFRVREAIDRNQIIMQQLNLFKSVLAIANFITMKMDMQGL